MSNNPAATAALILAGGRGERLGGTIKSELIVGGQRLLERVVDRLTGCSPLLVSHGRLDPALLHLHEPMIPVADLDSDYAGPLAGVAGAVAHLNTLAAPPELLVSVAVDTPFLPPDFVSRLLAAIGDGPAAIASYAGQAYPTNSIWRLSAIQDLPAEVTDGTSPRSLKSLGAKLGAVMVEWPESAASDPFANINTPEDLAEMRRRAGFSAAD
jgi:molybdenum cofactor guanylyltransferase